MGYLKITNSKTGKVYDSRGRGHIGTSIEGHYDSQDRFVETGRGERRWYGETDFNENAYLDVMFDHLSSDEKAAAIAAEKEKHGNKK